MGANTRAAGLVVGLVLFVTACAEPAAAPTPTPDDAAPPTPPVEETPPEESPEPVAEACDGQEVSFLLSFIPNVQHAGFLIAANRGYFEEEGLNVEVQPAGPGVSVVQAVADASVDIGQVDYAEVLLARSAGAPVVAFAQTYKDPFFFWYATRDSGIESLEDWPGQRVGAIQVGEYPERDAMLLEAGIDPGEINQVQQDFGIDDFLAGNLDLAEGVVFFHPASLRLDDTHEWPDDFHIFRPEDHGADVASQTLATNEAFLEENPDVLRCFLRASIRGWQDALDDPEAAVDDVMAFIPGDAIPRVHQELAIEDVLEIMGPADELLRFDPEELQRSVEILTEVGYLDAEIDVEDTYDPAIYDTMGPID